MDYKSLYKSKLTTAEKAAQIIKSGDWVDYGWTATTPIAFDAALAPRMSELTNVNFPCYIWSFGYYSACF